MADTINILDYMGDNEINVANNATTDIANAILNDNEVIDPIEALLEEDINVNLFNDIGPGEGPPSTLEELYANINILFDDETPITQNDIIYEDYYDYDHIYGKLVKWIESGSSMDHLYFKFQEGCSIYNRAFLRKLCYMAKIYDINRIIMTNSEIVIKLYIHYIVRYNADVIQRDYYNYIHGYTNESKTSICAKWSVTFNSKQLRKICAYFGLAHQRLKSECIAAIYTFQNTSHVPPIIHALKNVSEEYITDNYLLNHVHFFNYFRERFGQYPIGALREVCRFERLNTLGIKGTLIIKLSHYYCNQYSAEVKNLNTSVIDKYECCICYSDSKSKPQQINNHTEALCGHCICMQCVEELTKHDNIKGKCPMCRQSLLFNKFV